MRTGMRDVAGECGLRVATAVGLDPGRGTAERAPAVGADGEMRHNGAAVLEPNGDAAVADLHRLRFILDPAERKLGGPLLERGNKIAVLNIVAEGIKADLGRGEPHFRRPQQPRGVVDNAHDAQRRCVLDATRPYPERFQRRDRAGEEGGGAVVGSRRPFGDQDGFDTGSGKRNGGGQASRPAADHNDLGICAFMAACHYLFLA